MGLFLNAIFGIAAGASIGAGIGGVIAFLAVSGAINPGGCSVDDFTGQYRCSELVVAGGADSDDVIDRLLGQDSADDDWLNEPGLEYRATGEEGNMIPAYAAGIGGAAVGALVGAGLGAVVRRLRLKVRAAKEESANPQ